MHSAIEIRDKRPNGCNLYQVPAGRYRVACGPLAAPFDEPQLGLFTCSPSEGDASKLPDAPPELAALVRAHAPRYPLQRASYSARAKEERIAAVERLLDEARKRPPRASVLISADGEPAATGTMTWLAGLGDYVMGALACKFSDTLPSLLDFFSSAPMPPAPEEIRDAFMRGIREGSTWPWNCLGAELDARAKQYEDELEAQFAATRAEAEAPSPENDQTALDLGVVLLSFLESVTTAPDAIPAPLRPLVFGPVGASLDAARANGISDGERVFFLFPRASFLGARFAQRDLAFGVRIEGDDVIPPGTTRAIRAKTRAIAPDLRDWLLSARGRRTAPTTRHGFLSLEGRVRAEQFRALAEPNAADVIFSPRDRALLASAGRDGFELEDAVVSRVLTDVCLAIWDRVHVKPEGWDEEERRKARTTVHLLPGGKRVPYFPQEWQRPPFPLSAEEISASVASAPCMFNAGELVTEAPASVIDSVLKLAPFLDPLADVIGKTLEGRKTIRTSEVEDALRKSGKLEGELRPGERQRISLHLERLGGRKDREGTARVWRFES